MEASTAKRRWFSFSLRSLLILVSLAAIGLGWVAYERRQSRHELQIVEQLGASNESVEIRIAGRIHFESTGLAVDPSWWGRALSALCGPRVESLLAAHNRSLTDISTLSMLRNLETLDLGDTSVSDLTPLAALENLQVLYLNGTQIHDISQLAGLTHLKLLALQNTQVSDVALLSGFRT